MLANSEISRRREAATEREGEREGEGNGNVWRRRDDTGSDQVASGRVTFGLGFTESSFGFRAVVKLKEKIRKLYPRPWWP